MFDYHEMRRHKFRMNMDVLLVSKFISVSMYVHCVLTWREGVLANNGVGLRRAQRWNPGWERSFCWVRGSVSKTYVFL